jgi:four helix bundle protein
MEPAKSFEDLKLWQRAHQFVLAVYAYTSTFPREEMYGLRQQFRRAAVSIAANIAEGFKKRSKRDKANYMNISQGSLEECKYFVVLSRDLGFGENNHLRLLADEVGRMLSSYYNAIKSSFKEKR